MRPAGLSDLATLTWTLQRTPGRDDEETLIVRCRCGATHVNRASRVDEGPRKATLDFDCDACSLDSVIVLKDWQPSGT